jgi:PAS domain S-box-containing protein
VTGQLGERVHESASAIVRDRLDALLDASPDGISLQDRSGRFVYANVAVARLFGFASPEELIDATPSISAGDSIAPFELRNESGAPLAVEDFPGNIALVAGEEATATLRIFIRSTGEERFAAVRATPLRDGGAVTHALTAFHDVSGQVQMEAEIKASEAHHRQLVEAMPQMAWTTDPTGLVTMVNERWWRYTGVRREIGTQLESGDWVHPDDLPVLSRQWARSLHTGESLEVACRLRRSDGDYRWHLLRAVPLRAERGRITGWVGTCTDVDAAKRAEESLRLMADATARLDEPLDVVETARAAAAVSVQGLSDWCFVDLLDPDGTFSRLAVATSEEGRDAIADALYAYPTDLQHDSAVQRALSTGGGVVMDVTADVVDRSARTKAHARLIRQIGPVSAMALPLIARSETLGAILFMSTTPDHRFGDADLELAGDLARRTALAISNARLFRDVGRYKRILDASLDAVLMFDPTTLRVSYVNQGAIDQLGFDGQDILDLDATAIAVDLDEPQLRALIEPLLAGRLESRTVTLSLRHRSGSLLPVEVLLQYIELPSETGRIVAIARDISDRVEAQARLQRLAEAEHARAAELNAVIRAMGEGLVVCDAEGRITLANPAAQALFADAGIRTYDDILSLLDEVDEAPALGERGGPVDIRVRGPEERWLELTTYPVAAETSPPPDGAGVRETIVLVRDVTEARQRQTVRDTFIGVLSHELRTPVTTIYAGSKLLSRGLDSLDEDVRRSVFDDIHVESERLHRLVEDVIALTRFGEADEGEIGNEPVLLQRVLPGVVRSEETRWPGVTFRIELPGGIPTVIADPTYVEQVVRNLLSNAAKYGGPGSTVDTSLAATDNEVIVTIRDDGPGFPKEEADRLFDLYYRSPSTATSASGAGIGLFVCARLIRAMGGTIWATPRPGGGAEFGFSLQIMRED